ncbi:hypothetical protein C8Q80DRAFT_513556 [Daedaleopsis nitida]|nr:hypothetical protein C8Q80DRAFT_513556 [Daedaleopsis nitida]
MGNTRISPMRNRAMVLRPLSAILLAAICNAPRTRTRNTPNLPVGYRIGNIPWTLVDNTLSFLYSSAVARGVPHQVTRNLFRLEAANSAFIDPPPHLREGALWDGQLPPNDPKYQSGAASLWKSKGKGTQQKQKERLANAAMDTLSDLIGMAEGSGANGVSVLLGRVRRRR